MKKSLTEFKLFSSAAAVLLVVIVDAAAFLLLQTLNFHYKNLQTCAMYHFIVTYSNLLFPAKPCDLNLQTTATHILRVTT